MSVMVQTIQELRDARPVRGAPDARRRMPPHDVDAVARALIALLDEPDTRQGRSGAFDELRRKYTWDRAAEPLLQFCLTPRRDLAKAESTAPVQAVSRDDPVTLEAENAHLREIVKGYESGRIMRLMAALQRRRRSPK